MNLDQLSTEEQNTIYALPFYVATLIASADGNVDESEIKRAIAVIDMQTEQETDKVLTEFYHEVSLDFEDKLKIIMAGAPLRPHERTMYLSKRIAEANVILQKLDPYFAKKLYISLRDVARQIAKASGGIFGYGSIGNEESKLLNLNFLEAPAPR